ncbi:hypothetical protein JYU10_00700 [bacterium AH-315-J04]|nr:hypothetical protein [bacterium AH-315-J04]
MRKLVTVLQAVQRLIEHKDDSDDTLDTTDVQRESGAILHLLKVRSGSAAYEVAAPNQDDTLKLLREVSAGIDRPETADWLDSTLSSVKDISDVAKSLGCNIEFCEPRQDRSYKGVVAKITPTTFSEIEGNAYIKASTSIHAKIVRVGGATQMHCGIRPANNLRQKMIICRVTSKDLVRELGQYIYQNVILNGQATWLRHNWRLKHMVIQSIEPPKSGSILEALRLSGKAGRNAWDNIDDPDGYLAEIRGS